MTTSSSLITVFLYNLSIKTVLISNARKITFIHQHLVTLSLKRIQPILFSFPWIYRQAFTAVEKGYFDSVDDRLAERTSLQYEIPDSMTSYEAYQKFPHLVCIWHKYTWMCKIIKWSRPQHLYVWVWDLMFSWWQLWQTRSSGFNAKYFRRSPMFQRNIQSPSSGLHSSLLFG